jgi:hypothetical protein
LSYTPDNLFRVAALALASSEDIVLHSVPALLQIMSRTKEGLAQMSQFARVCAAGAPTPSALGGLLVYNSVRLSVGYGATEVALAMNSHRDYANDDRWQWLRIESYRKRWIVMEDRGSGFFECTFRLGWPSLNKVTRPDAYETNDLFIQHPTDSELWQYVGRKDEIINHSTGEKTNPLPSEYIVDRLC